eukprot:8883192-Lingulodinium_polyedra.AAC.1
MFLNVEHVPCVYACVDRDDIVPAVSYVCPRFVHGTPRNSTVFTSSCLNSRTFDRWNTVCGEGIVAVHAKTKGRRRRG